MAINYNPRAVTNGLIMYIDPAGWKTNSRTNGLTYWHITHGLGAHPITEAELDNFFIKTRTLRSSGFHPGRVSWGDANQALRWGGTADPRPSYFTGSNDGYCWLARGYLYAPISGTYEFVGDGDDAFDMFVNNVKVSQWYNGHGFGTGGTIGTLTLAKGWYPFQIRFEEIGGADGIAAAWKKPGDSVFSTIPGENFKPLAVDNKITNSVQPTFGHVNSVVDDLYIPFDGVSDNINCGNSDLLNFGTGDFTVSVWFTRNTNATTNLRLLSKAAGSDTADAANAGFCFFGSDSSLSFAVNPTAARTFITAATYSVGEWVHVTGVMQRGVNMRTYKNATQTGTAAAPSGSVSGTTALFIGDNAGTNVRWDGRVGSVMIYGRALSDSEVRQNFEATRRRFGV